MCPWGGGSVVDMLRLFYDGLIGVHACACIRYLVACDGPKS